MPYPLEFPCDGVALDCVGGGAESCKERDMARASASSSERSLGCRFTVAAAGRKGGGAAAREAAVLAVAGVERADDELEELKN